MTKINQSLLSLSILWFSAFSAFANKARVPVSLNAQSDAAMQKMILHYVNEYRAKHH